MAAIPAHSPVDFQFQRQGGADIQGEVQIWVKKTNYSPTDRPVQIVKFNNPLTAHEAQSISLSVGTYVCVFLGIAREALNGIFVLRLTIEGQQAFAQSGDVNKTSKPNEFTNFRADIELVVAA